MMLLKVKKTIESPYRWAVGEVGSKFFVALRDHQQILGLKCPSCGRVYVPPRQVCGPCFRQMNEWVEVQPEGVLEAFSIVNYQFNDPDTGESRPIPYVYGYIKLDGADTSMTHNLVFDPNLGQLRAGIRVRAVFSEHRVGAVTDISHFRPVGGNS